MRRGLLALAVFSLAGCGTGGMAETDTAANGQQLFQQKCGGGHALQDAGTRGTIGPDLDAAFAVPIEEGFDESSIREVTLQQMRFPVPPMPDDAELFPEPEFDEQERDDALNAIAVYVASVAARPRAAAAGASGAQDASDPKSLFSANCASCHTLAAAGATGTVGPSLDRTRLDVKGVARQIRIGGSGMPPFEGTLTDEQIQALAKFVAENKK